MNVTSFYAPITKVSKQDDGTLVVTGKATGPDLDLDEQVADPEWLAQAVPAWFQSGANVRQMHQPIAAGVGKGLVSENGDWHLESLVVDADSVKKIETEVLKGYSIGIRAPVVVKDAAAPGGRIIGGQIVEVSLVDRPANPTCVLALNKAAGDVLVAADAEVETDAAEDAAEEAQEAVTVEQVRQLVAALLYAEAEELLEGEEAAGAIRALLAVLSDLDWFEQVDAYEDTLKAAVGGITVKLSDITTAVAEADPTQLDELRKILATSYEPDLAKLVKSAEADDDKQGFAALRKGLGVDSLADQLTKATEASEERISALEDDLAKVKELAAPGAPARMRPPEATKQIERDELLAKAASFDDLASRLTDPDAAADYRATAKRLRTAASSIQI